MSERQRGLQTAAAVHGNGMHASRGVSLARVARHAVVVLAGAAASMTPGTSAAFAAPVAAPVAALAAWCAPAAPAEPAACADELPFTSLWYEEARDAAAEQHRLFIVEAMQTWSEPCTTMESTAWPEAAVLAWLAERAIAVQVDTYENPDLVEDLGIRTVPTILVFRDGVELDRKEGLMSAAELLTWLTAVDEGRAGTAAELARSEALLESDDVIARAGIMMGRNCLRDCIVVDPLAAAATRRCDELVVQHAVWLWSREDRALALSGQTLKSLLTSLKALADRDVAAREAFAGIYADVRAAVADTADPDPEAWREFAAWCQVFYHDPDLRAWYAAHHEPDGSVRSDVATATLSRLFLHEGETESFTRLGLLPAPAGSLVVFNDMMLKPPTHEPAGKALERYHAKQELEADKLRRDVADMCINAWNKGEEFRIDNLSHILFTLHDDARSRLVLVRLTLAAVGPRPEHAQWLDQAAARKGDPATIAALRADLAAWIAPPPPIQPASAPVPLK